MSDQDRAKMTLMSMQDILGYTGWGKDKVYAEIAANRFPKPFKQGGKVYWVQSDYQAWISDRRREAQAVA